MIRPAIVAAALFAIAAVLPAHAQKKGGTLTYTYNPEPTALSTISTTAVPVSLVATKIYESLLEYEGPGLKPVPGLAESWTVSKDQKTYTFKLRKGVQFHDGTPFTADDVLFSLDVLREKGWPYHRTYYRKVVRTEVPDGRTVRMIFEGGGDREMPLIMGLMPILPKHRLTAEAFERTTLEPVIGSGPYMIDRLEAGRSIIYRRNPDYWGRNLPSARGRFNFEEIRVEFFRDSAALFEAFKAGEVDVRAEDEPARWAEGYDFPAVTEGRIVKREFPIGVPAGMNALAMNTRRAVFKDPRVRRALIYLFDFDWINRSLYHGLFTRTESYFARSALACVGRPADERERRLLAPFAQSLPPGMLEGTWHLPANGGGGPNREALREAHRLLTEAGYALAGKTMVHKATGKPLAFEFLASNRAQERLMLAFKQALDRMGIAVAVRQVDAAQYWSRLKAFDFDMVQWTWGASLSPGNEQLNRWSSAAAKAEGSLNYPGVESPAVDAMIEALLAAEKREDFDAAVRALDRVLLAGDYVIPLFHAHEQWMAYWGRLRTPDRIPLAGAEYDTWWIDGK